MRLRRKAAFIVLAVQKTTGIDRCHQFVRRAGDDAKGADILTGSTSDVPRARRRWRARGLTNVQSVEVNFRTLARIEMVQRANITVAVAYSGPEPDLPLAGILRARSGDSQP